VRGVTFSVLPLRIFPDGASERRLRGTETAAVPNPTLSVGFLHDRGEHHDVR
jgi:hypothetical protein